MKMSDVKVGMRVTLDTCGYGTVRRVDYGAVFVQLDLDAEKRPGYNRAFTCEHIEPLEQEPRPVTATEVNVSGESNRARLQRRLEEYDRLLSQRAITLAAAPLLTPVPTTVDELVQSSIAEADAITGAGLSEWMRNHHPMDARQLSGNGINPQWFLQGANRPVIQGAALANEPASLRRLRERAQEVGGSEFARSYVEEYRAHLERYGISINPQQSVPPKAVPKPLAIGTPPRKLCLPEKP